MTFGTQIIALRGENSEFDKLEKVMIKTQLQFKVLSDYDLFMSDLIELKPKLVLLDLQLDERDAVDVLKELEFLEERDELTVVVLGDGMEKYIEITALNAGADDYLVKPINKRIFASRLKSWLRRQERLTKIKHSENGHIDFGLDRDRFSLTIRNREISLQPKEFEIIHLLFSKPRKVFTRKEIRDVVWGEASQARSRTVDVHITNLRSKIGRGYIKTYKGVGYSLEIPRD